MACAQPLIRQGDWSSPSRCAISWGCGQDVELTAHGAALRVVPVHDDMLVEADGRLVIPASGVTIGDDLVQALRNADRR
jgi:hypothetical protein